MLNKIKKMVNSSLKNFRVTSTITGTLSFSTTDPRLRNLYAAVCHYRLLCGIFLAAVAFSACAAAAPSICGLLWPRYQVCTKRNILLFLDLHHDLMFFIIVIVIFVSWMLGRLLYFYRVENTATPPRCFRTSHPARENLNLHSSWNSSSNRCTFLFSALLHRCLDCTENFCQGNWTPVILILRNY